MSTETNHLEEAIGILRQAKDWPDVFRNRYCLITEALLQLEALQDQQGGQMPESYPSDEKVAALMREALADLSMAQTERGSAPEPLSHRAFSKALRALALHLGVQ